MKPKSRFIMLHIKYFRSNKGDRNNRIKQIKQPSHIEDHKAREILLSNASPHPWTMVVVAFNTNVAFGTMHCIGRLIDANRKVAANVLKIKKTKKHVEKNARSLPQKNISPAQIAVSPIAPISSNTPTFHC